MMRRSILMLAFAVFGLSLATRSAAAKGKYNKKETRDGSYIVNNTPMADPPDLRGSYEKQRDEELMTHYKRLARLDYISLIAEQSKNTRLLERVETVRRREVQRHRIAMTRFWEQARGRTMVGF